MKRKFTFLLAALALLTFLIPLRGWGQTRGSYTITAKTGSGDGTSISTSTDVSNVFTETTYPNAFTTATKAYYGGSSGIKLGTSSAEGTLTFTLKEAGQVNAQTIIVNAKLYNSSKAATINVNTGTAQSLTADFADYTFTINQEISSIQLDASKYCWINSITVTYSTGGGSTPEIVIPAAQLALSYEENADGNFDVTYSNFTPAVAYATLYSNSECTSAFPTTGSDAWIVLDNYDDPYTSLAYILEANPAAAERTAYLKIEALDDESNDLDAVFTITQAGAPTYTVTYDANGGSGIMTDANSPYLAGASVTLLTNNFTAPEGMIWSAWEVKDAGNNVVTVTNNQFTMPASNVTVKALWETDPNATQYEWVATSLSDLTTTDIFVIVGNNGSNYAMKNTDASNSGPAVVAVTVTNEVITGTVADNIKWNVSGNSNDGYVFYPNGSNTTWLYCTDNNNGLRIGNGNTDFNTFEIKDSYIYNSGRSRYVGIYNSTDWRSYTSINNNINDQTFVFYKRQVASTDPSISASNVEIDYNATGGNIAFTVNNAVTGGVISAATTDTWITLGDETTSPISFTCSENSETTERTATVTLTYTYNTSETVTKNVTVTQAAAPVVYTTIPAIFEAATSTEANVSVTFGNWVVSGVSGSNAFVTDNNGNGFIIYKSSHGFSVNDKLSGTVNETPLKLYKGSAEFTNLTSSTSGLTVSTGGEITVITNKTIADLGGVNTGAVITLSSLTYDGTNLSDGANTIKPFNTLYSDMNFTTSTVYNVTGVYQQFGDTKEILPRSAADIVVVTIPVINADNVNIAYDATTGEIDYSITNPDGTSNLGATTDAEWISNIVVDSDKVTFTTTANSGTEDRTATFTLTYTGATDKTVTVTQGHYVVDYAILPFNWTGGTSSDLVALTGVTAAGLGSDYASQNAPYRIKMDGVGDYIQVKTDVQPVKVLIGVKMLGGSTTSKIKVQESANGSDFSDVEELTISGTQNTVLTLETSVSFAGDTRYVKIIKSEHASGGNIGVGPIRIAKYASFDKVISGYGTGDDKWYLIASPVTTAPTNVTNMIPGDDNTTTNRVFDLYYFDQTQQDEEWRNYRVNSFNLEPGQGYLYARKEGSTLTVAGAYFGNGVVDLSYESTADFAGWNLIGNPFATPATLSMPFYKMNDDGNGFTAKVEDLTSLIGIMEGVLVQASDADQSATFTATSTRGSKNAGIAKANINVIGANGSVIDNAIVRFDEGQTLEKFMFNENGTKVYFTEDHKDYAIVRSEARGEMPVNFKAAEDGNYTINVATENLDVNYLHLIDNKTGMDVDLLATPSYTFEGKRTDYASRFRLVFDANNGNNETSDEFAFMSDGNIIVNGTGTVQVIDMLGRQIFSHEVNSAFRIPNSEFTTGVYVLRLVNGNNVKTQKIVIK